MKLKIAPSQFTPDQSQYEAGEFAYNAFWTCHIRNTDGLMSSVAISVPEFRSIPLQDQKAWAFMAAEFKSRFACQA